jgi:hypothetical protein
MVKLKPWDFGVEQRRDTDDIGEKQERYIGKPEEKLEDHTDDIGEKQERHIEKPEEKLEDHIGELGDM